MALFLQYLSDNALLSDRFDVTTHDLEILS